jgi:acid stress-induced BolA-like protein IbaG/YrbA
VNPKDVKRLIEAGIPGARVEVHSPDGVHFEAMVIAAAFGEMRPVARHQRVYAALGDLVTGGTLHALALKTLTPEEHAAEGGHG